jgi:hypothetical protein
MATYMFPVVIALMIKAKEMNLSPCLLKYQAISRVTETVKSHAVQMDVGGRPHARFPRAELPLFAERKAERASEPVCTF